MKLTLKEIQKVASVYEKVQQGSYTRLDIESIEALIPGSINSEAVSVNDIPSGAPSNTQQAALINRFYNIKESIDSMLFDHKDSVVDKLGLLCLRLLEINTILTATLSKKINPINHIEKLYIKTGLYDYIEMVGTDKSINLYSEVADRLSDVLMTSREKDVSKSISELMYRIDAGESTIYLDKDNEWSGYLIKNLLGVDKVTYPVVASLLSNPRVMIDKINTIVDGIVRKVSITNSNIFFPNDYDASINSVVNLEVMAMQDSAVHGYMNDNTSLPIIKLYALALIKDLEL